MCLGGLAVGLGSGVLGQPWTPRIWQRAGHKATLGLPVMGARFPGRTLGALGNGAALRGSWGLHQLSEAIFTLGSRGPDSMMVELLVLCLRVRGAQGLRPPQSARLFSVPTLSPR